MVFIRFLPKQNKQDHFLAVKTRTEILKTIFPNQYLLQYRGAGFAERGR